MLPNADVIIGSALAAVTATFCVFVIAVRVVDPRFKGELPPIYVASMMCGVTAAVAMFWRMLTGTDIIHDAIFILFFIAIGTAGWVVMTEKSDENFRKLLARLRGGN